MFANSAAAIDFSEKIAGLCEAQSKWSQETFGSDEKSGPIGALEHLKLEADEAASTFAWSPFDRVDFSAEMADCLLLVIDASRRGGVGIRALIDAAVEKQRLNEKREWPTPVDDRPVEHIQ